MHEVRSWPKPPADLVERFHEVVSGLPDAQERQMFGYPAAFVNGNMFTSLHEDRWIVRLPDNEHAELMAEPGASQFEPMPGRPMKGYVVLPADVVAQAERARTWVERALAHGLSLPPKEPRRRTKKAR